MTRFPSVFRALLLLTGLSVVIAVAACDDDSTGPGEEQFSLEVTVKQPDGTPVEGLEIVVWNVSESLQAYIQDYWPKRRARTSVHFELPVRSVCWFSSYDLVGNVVQSVLEADTLVAGVHEIALGGEVVYNAGVEVMGYELRARDPEGVEEPFQDSKLMTIVHLDRDRIEGGLTGADGRYRTTDRTMVPGLFELPELVANNENGEMMGTFTLGNELRVVAYDEQGRHVGVDHLAVDGSNRVEIVWDPAALQPADEFPGDTDPQPELRSLDTVPIPILEYKLHQNFPNPYN